MSKSKTLAEQKRSRTLGFLVFACFLSNFGWGWDYHKPLTFEDRVQAQEAIDRVYYNHRIWPKENPGPKPPFEQMISRAQIEAKVEDYLKKSAALDKYWQRPLTGEQLQAEMDRMAENTKDAGTLHELLIALDSDPYLIAECLAKPVLADRLIRTWYSFDVRFHESARRKAVSALEDLNRSNLRSISGPEVRQVRYSLTDSHTNSLEETEAETMSLEQPDFDRAVSAFPEQGRISDVVEDSESFAIRWSLRRTGTLFEGGALVVPKVPFDVWLQGLSDLPQQEEDDLGFRFLLPGSSPHVGVDPSSPDSWRSIWYVPEPRGAFTTVWTGTEMIVWGGSNGAALNNGGRYNPSTDTWVPTSTGTNCPSARMRHSAVWTGTEMIVWGGYDSYYGRDVNTGGRYDPLADFWVSTPTSANCPSAREFHTAVWTGMEMIIWGGGTGSEVNTGGRYNPQTNSWAATSTGQNVPEARRYHVAVWTGTEMIVWGGYSFVLPNYHNNGGRYDPMSDTWTQTSTGANVPSARAYHSAVWTGSEMIVWGGNGSSGGMQNTGGRYDPLGDVWTPTETGADCPSGRREHTAVWTGTEMIVWGGWAPGGELATGARYDPLSGVWVPVSTGANCPSARTYHHAVWTGTEMIIWGGQKLSGPALNTGGRYAPAADTWVPTTIGSYVPTLRSRHTALWTGGEMIVWGGLGDSSSGSLNTGGRYTPATDQWTLVSTTSCPPARYGHTAVWTGQEMIIWGGGEILGGRYIPSTNSWTATSIGTNCPSARKGSSAVWTGTAMVVWGGELKDTPYEVTNTGGRYQPSTNTWQPTSIGTNCPAPRVNHSAIWTSTEMIVWGGNDYDDTNHPLAHNTGGRYNPSTDLWTATSTAAECPSARYAHTVVWTGQRMIIWGGSGVTYFDYTGGLYDPTNDTWTPTSAWQNPAGRQSHTAVWTGWEMIIWGGDGSVILRSGGGYAPATNTWTATSEGMDCPTARYAHSAVWTGGGMIVWDGYPRTQNGGIYYPNSPPRSLPLLSTSIGGDAVFSLGLGETLLLDGSASTDGSNPLASPPYHDPWDSLTLYEWDLNGDAQWDTDCATSPWGIDRTGAVLPTLSEAYLTSIGAAYLGQHQVWLRVTDENGVRRCASTTLTINCGVPGAPAITSLTDKDACVRSGITIAFTGGSGAIRHDLLKDGNWVTANITSPFNYAPGDGNSHSYAVRAIGSNCSNDSPAQSVADEELGPGAPAIISILDENGCSKTGMTFVFSVGSGATRHDLLRDGSVVLTDIVSPAHYLPGDGISHSYRIRAVRGACVNDSPPMPALDLDNAPVPTIAGLAGNPCPAAFVTLSTELGMTGYQWSRNGFPINGAVYFAYEATISGDYAVTYTNSYGCSGTSLSKSVTIIPCIVQLQYDNGFSPLATLTQLCGDGDAVVEPGEEWQVTVRLKNTGNSPGTDTTASLAVTAGSAVMATVLNNPAFYGFLAASGGTSTANYQFIVNSGATCVNNLTFDLTNIQSTEGSYPSQPAAFSVPIGSSSLQSETSTQQLTPLTTANATVNSNLNPAFTPAIAVTASLSYSLSYTQKPPSDAVLFGPDDFANASNWTSTGGLIAAQAKCASSIPVPSDPYYLINQNCNIKLTNAVSTVGYTNIRVSFSGAVQTAGATLYLDWSPDGTTWNNGVWSTTSTIWQCAQSVTLPSGAEGKAGFRIRFRDTGSTITQRAKVDYVKIVGTAPATGSWTDNARVSLVDPSNTATVLKAYGSVDANPYDVKNYYTGPGIYQIRLEENLGGTATLTTGIMTVQKTVIQCDVSSCTGTSAPPPVQATGANAARFTKNPDGNTLDVTYDAVTCSTSKAILLYGTIGSWTVYAGCADSDLGSTGQDNSVNTSGLDNAWFNIVWTQGSTAGHPGYGFNGTSNVARTWAVGTLCGMAVDDHSHAACP